MKKRKQNLTLMISFMVIIFLIALFCNINKDFLEKIGQNLNITKFIVSNETGIKFIKDNQSDSHQTVSESNYIPEPQQITKTVDLSAKNQVEIKNQTNKTYDINELLTKNVNLNIEKNSKNPQVLVIHTHGTESYTKSSSENYTELSEKRTLDNNYNVVKIADILAQTLKENGVNAVHATSYNDYPSYTNAYNRSLEVIEEYKKKYPSIKMVIDVHRDAIVSSDNVHMGPTTEINGKKTAQIMLVMGTDEGGLTHNNWSTNLSVAASLQNQIMQNYSGLMRPINLRSARFNQHATNGSMIVEVGASGNTFNEAKEAISIFATELSKYLLK